MMNHTQSDANRDLLIIELTRGYTNDEVGLPDIWDVKLDIEHIYRLYEMQKIIRFYGQTYWSAETIATAASTDTLNLENVAAHSFHVASAAQLLVPYFDDLDRLRVVELALLHDEAEIVIGDKDPVGQDGQGLQTHAFNARRRVEKDRAERAAFASLTTRLRPSFQAHHRKLAKEVIDGETLESRFVKAVDKLQALVFVKLKKRGQISEDHMAFTIRYSRIGINFFPMLRRHFMHVLGDILADVEASLGSRIDEYRSDVAQIMSAGERQ